MQSRLCHRIRRGGRCLDSLPRPHRSQVHDRSADATLHSSCYGLRYEKDSPVQLEVSVIVLHSLFEKRLREKDTCGIDEQIHAVELVAGLPENTRQFGFVGDIELATDHPSKCA